MNNSSNITWNLKCNGWHDEEPNTIENMENVNVKSIKVIAAQHKHIQSLQNKFNEDLNLYFKKMMSIPGWELFISKHTSTYQRPKEVLPYLPNHFQKLELVFDNDESIPTKCTFVIHYRPKHSSAWTNKFRTNPIDIKELDNFIQNKEN